MAKTKREFRSQKSYDAERISRDLVGPFLHSRGITVLKEHRVKAGPGESQILDARLPDGRAVRMRVRLCWRRDPGHVAARRYSALQLRPNTIGGDWEKTLRDVADRDAREGISHTLAFQRDGEDVPFAALLPSDALPAIWDAQRATSARLVERGELGRMRANHTTNGNSPTLWLQDDRHEAAAQVADVLWNWPGVITLARQSTPLPAKLPGSTTQRLLADAPAAAERSDRAGPPRAIATYVARLAYNSLGWRRPASATEVSEAGDTYRNEHGFGHEDWLFRDEWQIDGWRYGFVQGVNKSRKKLLEAGEAFDLRLFTMPGAGDRRAVAEIREVECLTDELAAEAVSVHEQLGWLDIMRREVAEAGGRPEALDGSAYAPFIFNLRYRLENLRMLDDSQPLPPDDPIHNIKRYSLCQANGAMERARRPWRGRAGTTGLAVGGDVHRKVAAGWVVCSPEHRRMQVKLLELLQQRYPDAESITLEEDFVDAIVRTADETLIFEVKSDLNPLSVLRQALGQLLEYAYHPRRSHRARIRLVVVGRRALSGNDEAYFETVRSRFGLPIDYWVVPV